MYWIVGLALLAAAIYGGYRLVTWPGFALRTVDVAGLRRTSRTDVLHQAGLRVGGNLWLMDLTAARNRVQALPYVRTATFVRIPPSTVAISVVERAPDGCLVGRGGQHALIDSDGRVLSADCAGQPSPEYRVATVAVPSAGAFVQDDELSRLQADAHALASDGHVFHAYAYDRFGEVDAMLPSGIVVEFGTEGNLQEKARLVEPILREFAGRDSTIAAIDLRASRTPVVRFRTAPTPSPVTTIKP